MLGSPPFARLLLAALVAAAPLAPAQADLLGFEMPGASTPGLAPKEPAAPAGDFVWGDVLDRLFPAAALTSSGASGGAGRGRGDAARGSLLRRGQASYYGRRFHGRPTANGERFDMNALTAASPDLRLGRRVRVVRVDTGRSLVVRINDRGPFAMDSRGRPLRPLRPHPTRVLDLSREAMRRLGGLEQGHIQIEVYAVE